MNAIALLCASLCNDCEHIVEARSETCPQCGARYSLVNLARLLEAHANVGKRQAELSKVCEEILLSPFQKRPSC